MSCYVIKAMDGLFGLVIYVIKAWAVCFPFSDHVIFPRELFFYLSKTYSFIYTGLFENLKARFLKSIITWSETGQQTVQARKVSSGCTWIVVGALR